jgi:mono/diheme cytochrome c family protein
MQKLLPIICLATAACVPEPEIPNGKAMFAQDCAGCHGADAMGAGPIAQAMGVAAPSLTQLSADNGGVFPRERVMAIIDGLNRDPHFSNAMPEFGAGDLGDAVIVETPDGLGTPTPIGLIALADYLESVQLP